MDKAVLMIAGKLQIRRGKAVGGAASVTQN